MNQYNTNPKQETVIALDFGTGHVKGMSQFKRIRFPSLYAYREPRSWEQTKEKTISGVGYQAVDIARDYQSVLLRPIREGVPSNKDAFKAVLNEAIRQLNVIDIANTIIVCGLPFHASKQAGKFNSFIEKSIGCKKAIIVPQTIGCLISENASSGIVISVGAGTTELCFHPSLNPETTQGKSLPQAVDYLSGLEGNELDFLRYENNEAAINQKRVGMLADIIAEGIISFKTSMMGKTEPDVYVSGGGILISGFYEQLQKKLSFGLRIVKDPVFSCVQGLYEYGKIILVENSQVTQP